ncbi:haloacid dehalogenase superfamily enzyme, subfamily IA [Schinkia azotoformans MEV2011]|uniref:Haloacid dehalogenase superfamily enzyme, subfamily IA n=1 Tax=Schinkia azotoformans MEV2011 TaxID=1348973 RepID=A0A072NP19_SCHAZ|nr:HAD-IA family hydrolase [Schinkia azotoformans]KEF39196.1 haloacid dehalogenase superfamily enzyme, subfamily IA [Schinkia azotoformans MEV2011]MEC1695863.1 HAD-IA family hydrolase [Schinkia azotoformans]MEC1717074.1 HAD-IA family hydrolase [Schinkia azotoformans]MEC1726019.1 HAD-IA family hydrolase [Schinkia azotoformans]MEC1741888.1 HAD-IA family hydrolase [Schinkia azotoformans]
MLILGREINTILFDKDGTIIDFPSIWIPWIDNIFDYLVDTVPECPLSRIELRTAFGAEGKGDFVDPKGPLAIASIEESKTIIAYKLYENGVPWDSAVVYASESVKFANEKENSSTIKAIDGIKEFLEDVRANNIRLGVLTADDTDRAWEHLKEVKLADYFEFVIGSDQVSNGKPFPDMAYLARDRYSITLSETMLIGDTNADMQLGKNAGVNVTVGIVTYSDNNINHLKDADIIIKSYKELTM